MEKSKLLFVEIITHEKVIFSGNSKIITVPGEIGSFQVLYNHAHILSNLVKGKIKVIDENDKVMNFELDEGYIQVENNKVNILGEKITQI